MHSASVEEAIRASRRGELERFGEVYDAYLERIYRFVFHRLSHKQSAEDVTSEIFMKALEHIKSYNPDKASFATWLYTIARNTLTDRFRKGGEVGSIDEAANFASHHDTMREAGSRTELEKVEQYLHTLDARERDIVMMRVWDDLPHKQIAEILGMSEAGVKMQYSRTIRTLKSQFGPTALLLLILLAS
jgi:RNA polymerase sigma-70 factor (ECF subfamily)